MKNIKHSHTSTVNSFCLNFSTLIDFFQHECQNETDWLKGQTDRLVSFTNSMYTYCTFFYQNSEPHIPKIRTL